MRTISMTGIGNRISNSGHLSKQLRLLFILGFATLAVAAGACTIGVARGTATRDGRPLLWKNRDLSETIDNRLYYNQENPIHFVSVCNLTDSTVWMGVNERGFAILNAVASDLIPARLHGNGELMTYALGHCVTLTDFEAVLDSTNVEGRESYGSFGVIDAQGGAAMYEVSDKDWWKYDTDSTGYQIRANFTVQGGGSSGWRRAQRSEELLEQFVAGDSLTVHTLLRYHLRDLTDSAVAPIPLPYEGYFDSKLPYGYISTDYSIAGESNVSATVIEGVLPGEDPRLTTMWSILGHPLCSPAVPVWPVGPVPAATEGALCAASDRLRAQFFDQPLDDTAVDTERLSGENRQNWLSTMFAQESEYERNTNYEIADWRVNGLNTPAMSVFADDIADDALQLLQNWNAAATVVPTFTAEPDSGTAPLTVHFTDTTLHGSDDRDWMFLNDGTIDSHYNTDTYTYSRPGVYDVTMRLTKNGIAHTVTHPQSIKVTAPITPPEPSDRFYVTNPNRLHCRIHLELNQTSKVRIDVFDVRGRQLDTVFRGQQDTGSYVWEWPGRKLTTSGVYLIRCRVGKTEFVRRAVIFR